ncbi:hypothetical protein KCU88_g425, partial [Aureobasidium melanogenum]
MPNRLMGTKVPHPPSTNFAEEADSDEGEFPIPPAKRVKTKPAAKANTNLDSAGRDKDSPQKRRTSRKQGQGQAHATTKRNEIPDSEEEEESGILENGEEGGPGFLGGTQLETTLPPLDELNLQQWRRIKKSSSRLLDLD